ncbi:Transcriptional activator-like protein [Hapsidospora chrysogenum ATCC 11550]|uniref:Transcriptional activator-like protein n=1 Tax=Hapsidospora chrysogenum (strain ATCC 11550 / CBS 779.69 / DSM 880 / IAM 14645 / JCM 23072 / IMI 49137) TaxID=857340 RepID=A0A086SZN2_HAPC1|nr:Transcriptional activator-like protein [Hapsidospora chrysogenum ATCC 11550]
MEYSPAESLLSAPCDNLPSLFSPPAQGSSSPTVNPMDMMTPQSSLEGDCTPSRLSAVPEDAKAPGDGEKKPVKKRKSWGQVLPEPKTNLPPRKRAKTEDEKEQRRVERVLRNRRAAQSSRERKRQETEKLEKRNQELELRLKEVEKANFALLEKLKQYERSSGVVPTVPAGSPLEHTLSAQLFTGQGLESGSLDDLVAAPTVNPASLSPEPVKQEPTVDQSAQLTEMAPAASSDMTQRPAEMLCDLQCQTSEEPCLPPSSTPWAWMTFILTVSISAILTTQRPLAQIALSLKAGCSIAPSPQILTTIIWLVTRPTSSLRRSTSTSGSNPRTSQRVTTPLQTYLASKLKAPTLRVRLLKRILSRSPNLARPLLDATFAALRLVSRGHDDRVGAEIEPSLSQGADDALTECLRRIDLPSREILLTLLWTIRTEQRRLGSGKGQQSGSGSRLRPECSVPRWTNPQQLPIGRGVDGEAARQEAGHA